MPAPATLLETYKESENLLIKYVAGSCLRRLMGGAEIPGFKRTRSHDVIFESLVNQQLQAGQVLTKSEIADVASGKWVEYLNFCQGSVTEALCSDLLPSSERIKGENEMLGATSMVLLKKAYDQFSGVTKKKLRRQLLSLYKETSRNSPLKRRVIDQIYREITQPKLELRKS